MSERYVRADVVIATIGFFITRVSKATTVRVMRS